MSSHVHTCAVGRVGVGSASKDIEKQNTYFQIT